MLVLTMMKYVQLQRKYLHNVAHFVLNSSLLAF